MRWMRTFLLYETSWTTDVFPMPRVCQPDRLDSGPSCFCSCVYGGCVFIDDSPFVCHFETQRGHAEGWAVAVARIYGVRLHITVTPFASEPRFIGKVALVHEPVSSSVGGFPARRVWPSLAGMYYIPLLA